MRRPARPLTARRLLLLATVFFVARGLLVLCAADRISEPDLAEVKLMAAGDAWVEGGIDLGGLVETARHGANAPHGGFLPISLAYAALAVPTRMAGSYGLLKLVALLLATLSFVAWVAVAHRLGGRWAATTMAVLLLVPPPALLGASLVVWGSHPEGAALLGPAAWLLLSGRGPAKAARTGAVLGLAAGFSTLLIPVAGVWLLAWAWDAWWAEPSTPWLPRAAAAGGAFLAVFGLLAWLSSSPDATVTEDAGSSPMELLHDARADHDPLVAKTAANLLPPRVVGHRWAAELRPIERRARDRGFGLLLLLALAAVLPSVLRDRGQRGRTLALLVLGSIALGAVLATIGPRRPWLPPRYLVALWAPALLTLSLLVGRAEGRWRLLAAAVAGIWLLPGLVCQAGLMDLGRAGGFRAYHPSTYVAAGIGHVGYEEAPAVNAFLAQRTVRSGFGLAAGDGGGEALLLDGKPPHLVDAGDLLARRDALLATDRGLDRRTLHENLGWGLGVFAPDGRGTWLSILERMGPDRGAVAWGLGRGLRASEAGCRSLRTLMGPDRDAVLTGARSAEGELPVCAF